MAADPKYKLPSFQHLFQLCHLGPAPDVHYHTVPMRSCRLPSPTFVGYSLESLGEDTPLPLLLDLAELVRDKVAETRMFCDSYLRKYQHIVQDSLEKLGGDHEVMHEILQYFGQLFTLVELGRAISTLGELERGLKRFKDGFVHTGAAPATKRLRDATGMATPVLVADLKLRLVLPRQKMVCQHCGLKDTPEWRRGPEGPRLVCNACGLFFSKLIRKYGLQEAALMMRTRKMNGQDHDRRVY